jgi:hypothetical protein
MSCAGDSVTEPLGSAERGQKKFRRSMRLVNRCGLVPSQDLQERSILAAEDEQMARIRICGATHIRIEQMSSGLPSKADIARCSRMSQACQELTFCPRSKAERRGFQRPDADKGEVFWAAVNTQRLALAANRATGAAQRLVNLSANGTSLCAAGIRKDFELASSHVGLRLRIGDLVPS